MAVARLVAMCYEKSMYRLPLILAVVGLAACASDGPTHTTMVPKAGPAPDSDAAKSEAAVDRRAVRAKKLEAESRLVVIIGTAGDPGAVVVQDVLADLDSTKLDAALAENGGVTVAKKGPARGGIGTLHAPKAGGGAGASPPRGKLMVGTTSTVGMDRTLVRKVLQRRANQVRHCYDKALLRDAEAGGGLEVELAIGPNGRARPTRAKASGRIDTVMLGCVKRVMRRIHFPKPVGSDATVTQSFAFEKR